MNELSLDELKVIELEILKMFDVFCKEHNIRYCLAYGTLLGAIRYKKFIPWDDDVDVLVPREDYDRLLKIFKDSEKYQLYSFERNRKYRFPFAKLCDMSTRLIETIYPNNGVELGVNIDIFPLDHWDNELDRAKEEACRINRNMMWLSLTKMVKPNTRKPFRFLVWYLIMVVAKLIGSNYFIQKIIDECDKPEQKGSPYVGVKAWCLYAERGIIPAEAFSDTTYVEFEGELFPAPLGYDTYLRCLYGDYMPEPPEEKRKTHHNFKAYRL